LLRQKVRLQLQQRWLTASTFLCHERLLDFTPEQPSERSLAKVVLSGSTYGAIRTFSGNF
jgi:hypothetical protein